MTVPELLKTVASIGGVLTLDASRVECDLPSDIDADLIHELRLYRDELRRVLEQRLTVGVKQWLRKNCVCGTDIWTNAKILHREFVTATAIQCTEVMFVTELMRYGYVLDAGMFEQLALRADVQFLYEERAAIKQHFGNMPRLKAEREAKKEIWDRMHPAA